MSYSEERSRHFDGLHQMGIHPRGEKDQDDHQSKRLSFDNELETPLDAFDKQLLSEFPSDRQQQASQGLARRSLPPRHQHAGSRPDTRQAFRGLSLAESIASVLLTQADDLYQTPVHSASSSTTIVNQPSSPTVSALQNRRSHSQRSRVNSQNESAYLHPPQSRDDGPAYNAPPSTTANVSLGHAPPVVRGIQLVPTSDLPDQLSSVFPHKLLNAMQSKCFPVAFHTDDNLVLSAPTGSGKTLVMELAICRLLARNKAIDFKVVYQAPTKALCAERYRDWNAKFGALGLECAELTGDTEYGHLRQVQEAKIIITTPEKWDSVTRKWRDQIKLIQLIKLFLVDEVHILKESRGATLEAVVSRMKSIGTDVRFVALSATVPNSEDIATWLGKDRANSHLPAQREVFDESYRPVKLEKHVYGFGSKNNEFVFDSSLIHHIPDIIRKHAKGKPTMIFCMTRKIALKTASSLAALYNQTPNAQRMWKRPARPVLVGDNDLKQLVSAGVAFHHAGIGHDDRLAVEQGFLQGDISIICSTSTLAVGINLPCYLVILRGTVGYGDGGLQEYSDLEVMQMLGRAGRPQFERSACAVIMTQEDKVDKYRKMVSGQQLLESTLHRNLIEHLNAEVGLGTIWDAASAIRWLSSTFLHVRLGCNPDHYHLSDDTRPQSQDDLLRQICERDIDLLVNHDCIEQRDRLRATEIGEAMARYYVKFETMKTIMGIPPKAKMSEILSVLSQAAEFQEVRFKRDEKTFYKKLNESSGIKFPVKVDIALTAHKISILLQAELGGVDSPGGDDIRKHHIQHGTDKHVVFGHAKRLIRCIIDCQLHLKDAVSVRNALELGRSIAARAWDNTPQQLREIPGIGIVYARKLAAGGINSIDTFINTEPERLDLVLGKGQPFGRNLLQKMATFPDLRIAVKEMGRELQTGKGALLKMKAEAGFINERVTTHFKGRPVSVIFMAEDSEGTLWDFRRFSAKKIQNGEDFHFTVTLTKPAHYIRCSIMCDEVVGTLRYAEAAITGIPTSVFPKSIAPPREGSLNQVKNHRAARASPEDDFGDDGLADGDLVAAGMAEAGVEVVQDIDDYPLEVVERKAKAKQKKVKMADESGKQSDNEVRDPVQLTNGRWACRHSCRDKGIQCRHKCCLEGVEKPNHSKKQVKPKTEETGQRKITSMASNTKKPLSREPKHVVDLDTLHTSATRDSGLKLGRVGSPTDIDQRPSKRQKSFGQDHVRIHDTDVQTEQLMPQRPVIRNDQVSPTSEVPINSTTAHNFDDELDFWDEDDNDWFGHNATSNRMDDNDRTANASAYSQKPSTADITRRAPTDCIPGSVAPPIPFLSLADLEGPHEKGLFITGQSSSPGKIDSMPRVTGRPSLSAQEDYCGKRLASEGDDLGMDDFDLLPDDDLDLDLDLDLSSPHRSPTRRPLEEVTVNCGAGKGPTPALDENETPQERDKRLWEEDQKRKWEGLDPWLYEQFHDIVELI